MQATETQPKPKRFTPEKRMAYKAKQKEKREMEMQKGTPRPPPTPEDRLATKQKFAARRAAAQAKHTGAKQPVKTSSAPSDVFVVKIDAGSASCLIGRKKFHSLHKDLSKDSVPGLVKWVKYGDTSFAYCAFEDGESAAEGAEMILALKQFADWIVAEVTQGPVPWESFTRTKRVRAQETERGEDEEEEEVAGGGLTAKEEVPIWPTRKETKEN